jgi:hypothetical protein
MSQKPHPDNFHGQPEKMAKIEMAIFICLQAETGF